MNPLDYTVQSPDQHICIPLGPAFTPSSLNNLLKVRVLKQRETGGLETAVLQTVTMISNDYSNPPGTVVQCPPLPSKEGGQASKVGKKQKLLTIRRFRGQLFYIFNS